MASMDTLLSTEERKSSGSHYTPEGLANFLAERILAAWTEFHTRPPRSCIDPAVGEGELLRSALKQMRSKGFNKVGVYGFDTNREAIENARLRLASEFSSASLNLACKDFLELAFQSYGETINMLSPIVPERFDIVIANPPYVRTQVMGTEAAQRLASRFKLAGRLDLAFAFIQGIAQVLEPEGIAGIIVSNRFMSTRSGASVRASIREQFEILNVWDLGDTKLFTAAVLPAVLLLKKKGRSNRVFKTGFTKIYSTICEHPDSESASITGALDISGTVRVQDSAYLVEQGSLDTGSSLNDVWRIANKTSDDWLATVSSNTFMTFGDVSKVRVGVKSTADKVFIRSDWHTLPERETPELLRPLTTHHIAHRYRTIDQAKRFQILYPHTVEQGRRSAITLEKFPKSKKYLDSHRHTLEGRNYVIEAGRKWYELWVPQDPDAWKFPKVVFRDIAEQPTFWMDLEGSVVNGDCYWISSNEAEQSDLLWLILAVGNSSFIEEFYDRRFNNKLYAGRRRFITQYVEKFPLPDPKSQTGREIIKLVKQVYELTPSIAADKLENRLDQQIWGAFGLPFKSVSREGILLRSGRIWKGHLPR